MSDETPLENSGAAPKGFMNWCRRHAKAITVLKALAGTPHLAHELSNPVEDIHIVEEAKDAVAEIRTAENVAGEAEEAGELSKDIKALGESAEGQAERDVEEVEEGIKKAGKTPTGRVPPPQGKPPMPKSQTFNRRPPYNRRTFRGRNK